MIGIALVNGWLLNKTICKFNVSRKVSIQKVSEELIQSNPGISHLAAKRKSETNAADISNNHRLKYVAHVLQNIAKTEQQICVHCVKSR